MFLDTNIERWFALYVKPRHEKTVHRLLTGGGRESFLPVYVQHHVYGRRTKDHELPLFPGYVFCRFDPLKRIPVLSTPGVHSIVCIGSAPVPIDDSEIVSLQSAMDARLTLEPCAYVHAGQRVRVTKGALSGVEGIVIEVKKSLRLVLSVTLLQRSVQCELDESWVEIAERPEFVRTVCPGGVQ